MALLEEMESQGNFLFKYRGQLPILILVVGIAIFVADALNPHYQPLPYTDFFNWFCLGVCMLGLVIRIVTIGFSPRNTSGRNTVTQVADEVNQTGIYATVRHPLYLGNFFMWFGLCLYLQNFWFVAVFVLVYWVYYERIMFAEEQFLRKKFGQEYVDWSLRTPTFIPDMSKWNMAKYEFVPKKVIKREYYGLFSVFLIFFFFENLKEYLHTQNVDFFNSIWDTLFYVNLALFVIIRILAKMTTIFHVEGR